MINELRPFKAMPSVPQTNRTLCTADQQYLVYLRPAMPGVPPTGHAWCTLDQPCLVYLRPTRPTKTLISPFFSFSFVSKNLIILHCSELAIYTWPWVRGEVCKRTLLKVRAWMSMWSDSHSGQASVIMTVTDRWEGSLLHRPCASLHRL